MTQTEALEIVTDAVVNLGYPRICPESLIALREDLDREDSFATPKVYRAYRVVMAGFAALLAPVEAV